MAETPTIRQGRVSMSEILRTIARELDSAGLIAKGKLPNEDARYGVEVIMDRTDHAKIKLRFVTRDDIMIEWNIDSHKVAANDGRKYLQTLMEQTLSGLAGQRIQRSHETNIIFPARSGVADSVRRTLH